jgi:DNA-binding NarL/FixJ family response regulator
VRTVLVCVRTPVAAQTIATCASRLGIASAVRTALSTTEALTHLATEPADVVLADTALTRPDSADFARRALAAAPRTALVLFGQEEPRNAAAAIEAGARGVIRGDLADPVTLVAKALLLLLGQPAPDEREAMESGARPASRATAVAASSGTASSRVTAARVAQPVPQQRGDVVDPPRRRVDLTERELQVLRGMAEGKSNAEIGRELFVSEDTVKTHARRLFRKLGARDRAHAVASAFRAGLVN